MKNSELKALLKSVHNSLKKRPEVCEYWDVRIEKVQKTGTPPEVHLRRQVGGVTDVSPFTERPDSGADDACRQWLHTQGAGDRPKPVCRP